MGMFYNALIIHTRIRLRILLLPHSTLQEIPLLSATSTGTMSITSTPKEDSGRKILANRSRTIIQLLHSAGKMMEAS
jgi:hypothetical protein